MGTKEFGLEVGDVVAGKISRIRFVGAEPYAGGGDYRGLADKRVLRFVSMGKGKRTGSPRTILLFPKVIGHLVTLIRTGTSSRRDLKSALKQRFGETHPSLAGVDYDYINVALHVCRGFQNADLPDDAPSGTALREVLVRQGQQAFRRRVLAANGGRCLLTRCKVASLLDAAHIVSFAKSESNKVSNGLLLRTDLHTLFDLGLLRLNPAAGGKVRVKLAASLRADSAYSNLQDKIVSLPDAIRDGVLANLRTRYQ